MTANISRLLDLDHPFLESTKLGKVLQDLKQTLMLAQSTNCRSKGWKRWLTKDLEC